jgi:hypothetical protein
MRPRAGRNAQREPRRSSGVGSTLLFGITSVQFVKGAFSAEDAEGDWISAMA